MIKKIFFSTLLVFFFSTSFLLTGCDEEHVHGPEDHFSAEGWMLRDVAQRPILVVWQGAVQNSWNGQTISDTLFATRNVLSEQLAVLFLDANKNFIEPPRSKNLGYIINDTNVVAIRQNLPGAFNLQLLGKSVGVTQLELQVMHEGHADVRTPKIPVRVRIN
ncbi:MAG: hypothetical protein C0425_00915 [Chlorobiaceae bacterium]|nr:hypothetical protein [Chlorobiaceae bacterium]MBA4308883.1 hypothetical protein [Chlorobiaceae bacterium]